MSILQNILVTSILSISLSAFAVELSPEEALARINTTSVMSRSSDDSSTLQLVATLSDDNSKPCVYVFAGNDDCIFASADSNVAPLLGYMDKAPDNFDLDKMPQQLKWLLEGYIKYASNITQVSRSGVNDTSLSELRAGWAPIQPQLRTAWNQGYPYNSSLPNIGINRCLTGCVATAMAQIMTYHQWPEIGRGSVEYTTYSQKLNLSMSFDTPFDWVTIASINGVPTSKNDIESVSYLMKACGYAVKSDYGIVETWAGEYDAAKALVEYFDYDQGCQVFDNVNLTQKEWESIIYKNLSEIGPVLYCGGGSGRHAFVCDGYDTDGLFHINWGWGGIGDGYFMLSALKPDEYTDHSLDASIVAGIMPNNGRANPISDIVFTFSCNVNLNEDNVLCVDYSWTYECENVEPIICLTDSDGKVWYVDNDSVSVISPWVLSTIHNGATVPDGEYDIDFGIYGNDGKFHNLYGANLSLCRYKVVVSDGKFTNLASNFNRLSVNATKYPAEVIEGKTYTISADVANNTHEYISRSVYLDLTVGHTGRQYDRDDRVKVNLEPGQSEKISWDVVIPTVSNSPNETSNVYFEISDAGGILDKSDLIPLIQSPLPTIVSTDIPEVFNNVSDVVSITIKGPYSGTPSFRVRDKETMDWIGGIVKDRETFNLADGEVATVTASGGIGKLGTTFKLESGEYILDFYDTDRDMSIQTFPIVVDDWTRNMTSIGIYTNRMTTTGSWLLCAVVRNNIGVKLENIRFQPSAVVGNMQYMYDRGNLNFETFSLDPYEEIELIASLGSAPTNAQEGKQRINVELFGESFSFLKGVDFNVFADDNLPSGDLTPALECIGISPIVTDDSIHCSMNARMLSGVLNNPVRFRLKAYDDRDNIVYDRYSDWIGHKNLYLTVGDIVVFAPSFKVSDINTPISHWTIECLSHKGDRFSSIEKGESVFYNKNFTIDYSGISAAGSASNIPDVRIAGEAIIVSNLINGTPVTLYDTSGRVVFNIIADCEDVSIPTVAGLYILKVGNYSVKLLTK